MMYQVTERGGIDLEVSFFFLKSDDNISKYHASSLASEVASEK